MLISWKRFSPGYITGGRRYVSFRFPRKERWYLRNKRSRLNALLAIRAINGASTLISCLRYLPPPLARQWWDINTRRDVFALIDFRLSPSPLRVIRSDLHRQFLKKGMHARFDWDAVEFVICPSKCGSINRCSKATTANDIEQRNFKMIDVTNNYWNHDKDENIVDNLIVWGRRRTSQV